MKLRVLLPVLTLSLSGCTAVSKLMPAIGIGSLTLNGLAVTTVDSETQTVLTRVNLRWPAMPNAKTYEVIRTFGSNPAKVVTTTSDTSYVDSTLSVNQSAVFKVRALSGENKELTTSDDKAMTVLAQTVGKPDLREPVDNATLSVGLNPTLKWSSVPDASLYYVRVVRGDNDAQVFSALCKETSIKFANTSPLRFDNFSDLFPTGSNSSITRGIVFRWTVQAIRTDQGSDPNQAKGVDVNSSATFRFSQGG